MSNRIQSWFKGFRIRKSFNDHRALLLRHERLLAQKRGLLWKITAKTAAAGVMSRKVKQPKADKDQGHNETGETESSLASRGQSMAGHFLSHMVEATHLKKGANAKSLYYSTTSVDQEKNEAKATAALEALSGVTVPDTMRPQSGDTGEGKNPEKTSSYSYNMKQIYFSQ